MYRKYRNEYPALLFCLLLFFGLRPGLLAQESDLNPSLVPGETVLLVRLPVQAKQQAAMQAVLDDPQLSERARRRLSRRLADLRREQQQQNAAITAAFAQYFDALPVYFVPDSTRLPGQAVWLDTQGLTVDDADIRQRPIIQLRFGRPRSSNGSRPEAMVLTDAALQELGDPFPRPVQLWTFGYALNRLLAPETAFEQLMKTRVSKLNEKFLQLLEEPN